MNFEPDRQLAELQVMQMIPWLGRLQAEERRARLEALVAQTQYQAERLRVLGDIRTTWYKLYVLRKQIETTEADKAQLESLVTTANARVRTGDAQPGDVLMATLELSSLQEQLISYRQQIAASAAEAFGLWLDGHVYRGANGGAAELGHMVVRAGGLPCACGSHGCLEAYASGRALVRYAAARAGDPEKDPAGELTALQEQGKLTGGAVTRLAQAGDKAALEAVQELGRWLGVGLSNLTNAFDPEMIVVGGGVGDLGELLLVPAREVLRKLALAPGRDKVRVESASLGNRAGLTGGGLSAWRVLGDVDSAAAPRTGL
jgi:hypothetical protein